MPCEHHMLPSLPAVPTVVTHQLVMFNIIPAEVLFDQQRKQTISLKNLHKPLGVLYVCGKHISIMELVWPAPSQIRLWLRL